MTGTASTVGLNATSGTIIRYSLPLSQTGHIEFFIYNLAGELVRSLDDGNRAGNFEYYAEWDGKNAAGSSVASGIYFCQLKRDGEVLKTFKMAVKK